MKRFPAGRLGDAPSVGLSASLKAAGFKLGRLQTGTPARLDGKTIDFSNMARQDGDVVPTPFSFLNREVDNAVCHMFLVLSRIEISPTSRTAKYLVTKQPLPLPLTRS
jgi:tRNA uridine 5-carboxymethylaminomethyl modification enzyme